MFEHCTCKINSRNKLFPTNKTCSENLTYGSSTTQSSATITVAGPDCFSDNLLCDNGLAMTPSKGAWAVGSIERAPPSGSQSHQTACTCSEQQKSGSWAPGIFGCDRPCVSVAEILAQISEQNLEAGWVFPYNAFHEFVFAVHPLHPQNVITEVKCFETALLAQQHENSASSPVQAFAEQLPAKTSHF